MKKRTKFFLLIIAIALVFGFFYFWFSLNIPVASQSQKRPFVIKSGEGSWLTARSLKKQGFVRSAVGLEIYWWYHGLDTKVKPGEITLDLNWNAIQIANYLTGTGFISNEITLQFIEGWNNRQAIGYLQQKTSQATEFEKIVNQPPQTLLAKYSFLADKPTGAGLEGYLFPDTYRVYADASAKDILNRILNNFGQKFNQQLQQEVAKQNKKVFEVLIMASIVEKEVGCEKVERAKDCAMVADVFWKRLKAGMPLQSDATVNYATQKKTTRASAQDLKVNSLYNTYKYKGLPPGPICNPGLAAIRAAIYPQANAYYYFLTTDDGQVIYSRTGTEHTANVRKYLK